MNMKYVKLAEIKMSTRLYRLLTFFGGRQLETLGQVCEFSSEDILKWRGMGQGTLAELELILDAAGLKLRPVSKSIYSMADLKRMRAGENA